MAFVAPTCPLSCLSAPLQENNRPAGHAARQAVVQLLGSLEPGRLLRPLGGLRGHCAEEAHVGSHWDALFHRRLSRKVKPKPHPDPGEVRRSNPKDQDGVNERLLLAEPQLMGWEK